MSDKTKNIGRQGEHAALQYLQHLGMQCLEKNWRKGRAEIDLIMKEDDVLVFVEVKRRKIGKDSINPFYLSEAQMRRIADAGAYYMQKIQWQDDFRFDVVLVTNNMLQEDIAHIPDAFRA